MSELFKLKNGTVLISTEAPGGIYNSAQLKKIAELCSKELAIVKATEDQRLALFVKESEIERITTELKATGLGFRNYQSGLHQPVSCLGELCETHEQPALTTAMDLTKLIANLKLQSTVKIGINGCARCCAPCHTLDISVIGEASGYRISMGGKTSQFPELASFFAEAVPADKLPRLLTTVIEIFQSKAEEGESFNEFLDRSGVEDFIAALAPYSQDAAHRDDPFAVGGEETADEREIAENPLENAAVDDDFLEVEMEEVPEIQAESDFEMAPAHEAEDFLASDNGSIDLEVEESEVDHDEMSYDLSSDDSSDSLDEIPISSAAHHTLNDDIVVSDLDTGDVEEMSLDSFEEEAEMVTELLDAPEPKVPSAKAVMPTLDEDEKLLDLDDKAQMVSAALESESEIELTEAVPDEVEDELDFEESDEAGDGAMMSEELTIHEPELLDSDEDLEADVPLLAAEEAEIPELDKDLLQSNEIDTSVLDESEDDSEGDMMSIEDEQRFEKQINASIEEEKKMRDDFEEADSNQSARADALRMLESASEDDEMAKEEDDLSALSAAAPAKAGGPISSGKSFEFDGFDVTESTMRVHFSSGAYLDVQLDSLEMSRSKVFRVGRQSITVTHEATGYSLEVGGMRMFYPHQNMRAAS
ncbi:MAG: hypothetical protein H7318_03575 [Oligoflexus sp.]|nr:hypothetical protein [Oligoflexus sp.]